MNYKERGEKIIAVNEEYLSDSLDTNTTYMGRKVEDIDEDRYRTMTTLGDEKSFNKGAQEYLKEKYGKRF